MLKLLAKWVVPEKIHTPPTDEILEILEGGGGQGPWKSRQEGGLNSKKSSAGSSELIVHAIRTFSSVTV